MRLLLDNCVHQGLASRLRGHEVVHTREMGWQDLANGRLLAIAEEHGFAALLTVDKNMRHQQNLAGRRISLVTLDLPRSTLNYLIQVTPALLTHLESLSPGSNINVT